MSTRKPIKEIIEVALRQRGLGEFIVIQHPTSDATIIKAKGIPPIVITALEFMQQTNDDEVIELIKSRIANVTKA